MTYLNSPTTIIPDPQTAPLFLGESDERASLFMTLLKLAMVLLARFSRARGPKTRRALVFVLAVLLCLHDGTDAEKKAFLASLIKANETLQNQLYAAYLVWRQRKCWMWGGGFFAGAITTLPVDVACAGYQRSFAALIPD